VDIIMVLLFFELQLANLLLMKKWGPIW